jgi:PAS domain S-box-containing protein
MSSAEEITRLRDCLSQLVGLTALPLLGTDDDPERIVTTLLDALLGILGLGFVFVRLNEPGGGRATEIERSAEPVDRATARPYYLASTPLGTGGDAGTLVAGSANPSFPAHTDLLLLQAAANQTALVFDRSRTIAARKRAEKALRESDEGAQAVIDSIPAGLVLMGPDGEVQIANQRLVEYFGRVPADLKEWISSDAIHPEDRAHILERFLHSLSTGDPHDTEVRHRRVDGVYRWVRVLGVPLRDAGGAVTRWCLLYIDIDDRKRAEAARLESERESRLIVDSIPGMVALLGPRGEVEVVNHQILEYSGQTFDELKRWGTGTIVHPDDLQQVIDVFGRSIASGSPYDIVQRFRRFDGEYRWFINSGFPVRDSSGQVVRWCVLLTDIDDQKRAQDAIQSRERDLKLIIDSIPALAWSARIDGSAEFFSEYYLNYLGFSAEQAAGWEWTSAVHPDDLSDLSIAWGRILTSAAPGEAEARLRRRDGEYRWFLFRANPLRDETGAIVKWYGVNTDIEDRKRAEAELRRAYDSFSEAQRLSKTGSFITDLVADDHNWSEEAYRIFEFDPRTKVTVQRVRNIIHADDLATFESVIAQAMTGKNVTFGFRIVTARAVKHIRGVAHISEHLSGRPMFIGALQDVTETVVAEEALSKARAELAHVTRVTTLSALTASLAHEVNQPLSGILTNAGTCLRLLDGSPPNVEGARETARRTIRDANRASDVITRLRALFTRKDFTPEPVDLNEATRELIALSSSDLQRDRVVLHAELDDNLPIVTGDRIQLQQVVLNLIRNGSDAMVDVHDRPRQLLIQTQQESAQRVRLTVRDSGVGLGPDSLDSIFDPFYTTKSGGMGVGLFVSRSIIERHQGRLWAEPNDGPGATFAFSIPCGQPPADDAADTVRGA